MSNNIKNNKNAKTKGGKFNKKCNKNLKRIFYSWKFPSFGWFKWTALKQGRINFYVRKYRKGLKIKERDNFYP